MMGYYEFRGSYIYAVDSESFEDAQREFEEKLDEIFMSWNVDTTIKEEK